MKARQEIVTAFINKLEKADIADVDLIPALMDYVSTGDRTMFDEYNQFRKMADTERRAKEMELRAQDAKKRLADMEEQYRKTDKQADDLRSQIMQIIGKYQSWLHELRHTAEAENPQRSYPNMKALRDFAQACIDSTPNGYQRKLYIMDGNKLKPVTAILSDGKKAILETADPTTILAPIPDR